MTVQTFHRCEEHKNSGYYASSPVAVFTYQTLCLYVANSLRGVELQLGSIRRFERCNPWISHTPKPGVSKAHFLYTAQVLNINSSWGRCCYETSVSFPQHYMAPQLTRPRFECSSPL